MGWYLFRRKALIYLMIAFFLEGGYSSGEQERVPEQPASMSISRKDQKSAQRSLFIPLSYDVTSVRQSHCGPEVLSSVFTLEPVVEENYKRILKSTEDQIRIQIALERAKPYASFIRKKIDEYRLPPEIFYLPIVESLYNPFARSPQGAVGIWQFMADSMHPWMVRNEWVDERRDFWKSTIGAFEKLSLNYRYTKDWLFSLAAYNCGLNRVLYVMQTNPGKDYWKIAEARLLPRETRAYIPRFLAVARYAAYLGRKGFPLDWEGNVQWIQIPLSFPVDLRVLAKKAGISLETLLVGNRELQFPITPPKNYALKVPEQYAEKIQRVLNDEKNRLLDFVVHTVGPGDTLYDLSLHFGPPISMLVDYNPGVRPEALQVGMKLLIPKLKDVGPFKRSIPVSTQDLSSAEPFTNTYMVQEGDSLWSIARSFRTSVDRLARENNLRTEDPIYPGITLKVP
ncbi:MAG: LysM peptidoglycan-binding domain-containing protein [Spirochaetes bacterium]|nr:LysM peptidoglycan-binding domain-containing protein [Spirochaetota bacterium]